MLEVLFCTAIGTVLFLAAVKDFKTKTVNNIYPYSILVMGLLNHWLLSRSPAYLLGVLLAVPFLVAFNQNKIGGADVKMITVLGIYWGPDRGFFLIFTALLTASLLEVYKRFIKKNRAPYPFVPYLMWGYFLVTVTNIMKVYLR